MKPIVIVALLLLLYNLLPAQTHGPRIEFETTTIDAGEILQGSRLFFAYPFKNVGDRDLIFQSVKSSCGCYVPYWKKDPVKPGETDTIFGQYDTNRIGAFAKSLSVQCNDSLNPMIHLMAKGVILSKPIQDPTFSLAMVPNPSKDPTFRLVNGQAISSSTFKCSDIPQDTNEPMHIPYENVGLDPLLISNIIPAAGLTVVDWPEDSLAYKAKDELLVQVDTGTLGAFGRSLIVYTNHPTEPMVYVHLEGKIVRTKESR